MLPGPTDSLETWIERYHQLAIVGVRSDAVAHKIALHLDRFVAFFRTRYGHDRISTCLRRDVQGWQAVLQADGLAAATINNYLASLSAFTSWVHTQAPGRFAAGDPAKGISAIGLPPLEPRALHPDQVQSLKNLCDRLQSLYALKGRVWATAPTRPPTHAQSRPWRDRAIVFVMLSTGLRREEVVHLNLDHVVPHDASALRGARRAHLTHVRGKGKTERAVFLSLDARTALADYLERERAADATSAMSALFLSARTVASRSTDGRLSPRAVNLILEQIGRWHDAEFSDRARHISPLRPHDLRHTFAFQLARATGADAYELERRLGHRSQRYIQRYTNPPADVAAQYVEDF